MKVAYIAGPYRGPNEWPFTQNIRLAEQVALELWKMGYAVICPHKNTAYFGGACTDLTWLLGDQEFVRRSDVVVMLPEWFWSAGASKEHSLAVDIGKVVRYWPDDEQVLREEVNA